MEAVIDIPALELPRFVKAVGSLVEATGRTLLNAWTEVRDKGKIKKEAKTSVRVRSHTRAATARCKENLRQALAAYFEALDVFMRLVPDVMTKLDIAPQNAAQAQAALVYCTGLRKVLWLVDDLLFTFKGRLLNSSNFKKLRKIKKLLSLYVDTANSVVFRAAEKEDVAYVLKDNIGGVQLVAPLRIFVEDDDTGKHVSCLEFPMLYGFGDTEAEAIEMLDREILSLCEDAEEFPDLPDEYRYAALLANMAAKNAKQ